MESGVPESWFYGMSRDFSISRNHPYTTKKECRFTIHRLCYAIRDSVRGREVLPPVRCTNDRFSISSLRQSADTFIKMIRHHWDIENKLHWSLDVTCNEDRCRIRKDYAPANRVAVRPSALHLLWQEHTPQMRLRQQRLLCGHDEPSLLTVRCRATSDAITPSASPVRRVRSPWECSMDTRVLSTTALWQLSCAHRPAASLVTTHR